MVERAEARAEREGRHGRGRLRFRAAAARVARERREARKALRSDAGPGATMGGTALGMFRVDNRARVAVFRIMHSQRWNMLFSW